MTQSVVQGGVASHSADGSSIRTIKDIFAPQSQRKLLGDLYNPNPLVYWVDMLLSAGFAWVGFLAAVSIEPFTPLHLAIVAVTILAFYRAILFTHEISHFRRGYFTAFIVVWNIVVGIPALLPSFLYDGVHSDHHKRDLYGTVRDPEYVPFARQSLSQLGLFFVRNVLAQASLILRFTVGTLVSYTHPKIRRVVLQRFSGLVINDDYVRELPDDRRAWVVQELGTLAFITVMTTLLVIGVIPLTVAIHWFVVCSIIAFANAIRTLASHLFENHGDQMSVGEQLLDSCNVPGPAVLAALWAPVGLRYHALHHLLPAIPYHNLGRAHRRLMTRLPEGSIYRQAEYRGLLALITGLIGKSARVT